MKNSLKILGLALFTITSVSLAKPAAVEAATCVTSGNEHGYGGLIVNVRYKDYETGQYKPLNNMDVKVSTYGSTLSPPGNVVQLNGGPEGVSDRREQAVFSQVSLNYCDYNSVNPGPSVVGADNTNVVLGDQITTTSSPSGSGPKWAIDCDASKRGIGNEQLMSISPAGNLPNGVRDGGSWDTPDPFRTPNGKTTFKTLTYHEPAPPQPPNFNMDAVCNPDRIRLWGASDPDKPGAALRYRIWRGGQLVREGYVNGGTEIQLSATAGQQLTVKLFGKNSSGAEDGIDRQKQTSAPDCGSGSTSGNCNIIRFQIPGDAKPLSSSNQWNTPNGQSYYAVYVNDWGSPGRPVPAGSPDYYPNGSGSPAGSGKYNSAPGPGVDYSSYDHPGTESVAQGSVIERNLREHNKVVSGQLVWTLVVYDWFRNNNGVWRIQVQYRETNEVNNCWQADCSIQISGNVPGREGTNAVRGGQTITGTVTIRNTGVNNLPSWMITNSGTFGLSLTTNYRGGLSSNILNENIPPGGSITRPLEGFGFVAPNDVNNHTLSMYPDYWGRAPIGAWCSAGFQTFKEFDLALSANTTLSPTKEDPSVSQHRATIGPGVTPVPVTVPYTARSTLNGSNLNSVNTTGTTTINYAYDHTSFPNLRAGDEYCTSISTPNGSGWVGPGNDLVDANHPKSAGPVCDTIHDRPYISAYGGDIIAGTGGFYDAQSASCDTSGGAIKAYTNSSGSKGGSGSQLAALANGDISGFASASMTAAPLNRKLSFANTLNNTGSASGDLNRSNLGGQFNQYSCITNYFESTQYPVGSRKSQTTNPNISPHSLANNKQTLVTPSSGKARLLQGINYARKHTVYVNGDVVINGNITYANWNNISDIPNFTLVVRGNIYIRNTVTRLDGLYIAQPREPGDTGSGKIYTCVQNSGDPFASVANIDDLCDNQLTIYGALIAERTRFLRTKFTLRNSVAKENYQDSKAAEKIIYTPELYLSPPIFDVPGSVSDDHPLSTGIYESITTLPPIL